MTTHIILIVLLCIYCVIEGSALVVRARFNSLKRKMIHEIVDRTACRGHIVPPDDEEPLAVDALTGKRYYIFVEESYCGERMIFISQDCENISVMPWRTLNGACEHRDFDCNSEEEHHEQEQEVQEAS